MTKKILGFCSTIFIMCLIVFFIKNQNLIKKRNGQPIAVTQIKNEKQDLIKTDHSPLSIIDNETIENDKNVEDNSKESQLQNNAINETNISNDFNENKNINQEILVDNNQQDNFVSDNPHNNDSNQNITIDNSNNNITNDNSFENQNTQVPVNNDSGQDVNNSKEYHDTMELCTDAGFQVGFKDTVDILSTYCGSVVLNGEVKYKLYVICKSGNCDKYIE